MRRKQDCLIGKQVLYSTHQNLPRDSYMFFYGLKSRNRLLDMGQGLVLEKKKKEKFYCHWFTTRVILLPSLNASLVIMGLLMLIVNPLTGALGCYFSHLCPTMQLCRTARDHGHVACSGYTMDIYIRSKKKQLLSVI